MTFEDGFTLTAEIIGGCILHTRNQGRASDAGVRRAFDFTDGLIEEHFADRPFVHILDYTRLGGTTLEGRRSFIKRMLQRRRLQGVVFYGLSPMLRMSTKLGIRLRMIPFDVHIARDYTQAVQIARRLLAAARGPHPADPGWTAAASSIEEYRTRDGVRHKVLRSDDWRFESEDFRFHLEIIDGHILHSISHGILQEAHLAEVVGLRERVAGFLLDPQGPHWMITGLQDVKRLEGRARQLYLDSLVSWHRSVPLNGYIAYGLNHLMASLANFSRFILPFPVATAENLDDALRMVEQGIQTRGKKRKGRRTSIKEGSGRPVVENPVEHLLEYIGGIDWERDGLGSSGRVPGEGELRPVYDAISVIKSELDDLFREKVAAETALKGARDELETRVRDRTAELVATNQRLEAEIAERRQIEAALRDSERNYRDLVDSVNSIILRWDAQGRIVFMNSYGLTFFGYETQELIGRNVVGTIVPESESISQRDLKCLMQDIRKDPDRFRNNENENMTRDGRRVWVYWTNRAISDAEGGIVEILSVGNDITERRHMEAELRRLATTDALTGAFNRRRFFQKARQEFLRHQRYGHPLAVLLMDLDHFKKINDTHGHPAGDAVLKTFVKVCERVFRATDVFGRTGGEEFSAILPETEAADAARVAERLRDRIMNNTGPTGGDGTPIPVTVSIGLTALREDDMTLEAMIRRADRALYAAKRAGRNRVMVQESDTQPHLP